MVFLWILLVFLWILMGWTIWIYNGDALGIGPTMMGRNHQ